MPKPRSQARQSPPARRRHAPAPADNVVDLGDILRLRKYIADKKREYASERISTMPVIDIAIPHARNGKRPNHVIAYRRTGCMTKERVAVLAPSVLTKLCLEFGWCFVWHVPDQLIVVSRGVLAHFGKYLPFDDGPVRSSRWGLLLPSKS